MSDSGHDLAVSRFDGTCSSAPADVLLVAHVRRIRDSIARAKPDELLNSKYLSEALETLKHACDQFIGWHSRVEPSLDIEVSLAEQRYAKLKVRRSDGTRSQFELESGRWRRNNALCKMLDVALECGCPVSFVEGIEVGITAVIDALTDHRRVRNITPQYVGADRVAEALGVPLDLIQTWIDAKAIPSYTLPSSDTPWFKLDEVKKWAASIASRHEGMKAPPKVQVEILDRELVPSLHNIPVAIRNIDGLRQMPIPESVSGVYFLCNGNEVVYVGQATSILARIGVHLAEAVKEFDRAFFIPCTPKQLDRLERELIDALLPKYNADFATRAKRKKAGLPNPPLEVPRGPGMYEETACSNHSQGGVR